MKILPFFKLVIACMVLSGCTKTATQADAGKWLTAPEQWYLKEVIVNGKPVYKDGEVIEQFGEVAFSRYMEKVSFGTDGKFTGTFKGNTKIYSFNWLAERDAVVVSDTIPNSGKWRIPYRTLTAESFDMETETTAFNPPNVTRIRLHFRHEDIVAR